MSEGKGHSAPQVTEAQIQAYADGRLTAQERTAIEGYLEANPGEFARVEAYVRQNHALHALFDDHASAPLPEHLKALADRLAAALAAGRREG